MEQAKDVRKHGRRYTKEFKLQALALAGARGRSAAIRELGLSSSTFQNWTQEFPKEWSEALGDRSADSIAKNLAIQFEELVEGYTEAEQKAITKALDILDEQDLDAKEIAALIKSMGSSRGVAAVNARQARGEPDKSVDVNINFPQLEQAAEAILAAAPPAPALPVPNLEESGG